MNDLYKEICNNLTDFLNNDDEETTDGEWCDVFYGLLVKVKNYMECEENEHD